MTIIIQTLFYNPLSPTNTKKKKQSREFTVKKHTLKMESTATQKKIVELRVERQQENLVKEILILIIIKYMVMKEKAVN